MGLRMPAIICDQCGAEYEGLTDSPNPENESLRWLVRRARREGWKGGWTDLWFCQRCIARSNLEFERRAKTPGHAPGVG